MKDSPIRAFLDLGTNATKLAILQYQDGNQVQLMDAVRVTRLGEGAIKTRRLQPDAIQRTIDVIDDLIDESTLFNPASIDAVGTAILRYVENRVELFSQLYDKHGIKVRLLTDEEESNATFYAVRSQVRTGAIATLDVGGGSTDFAFGKGIKADRIFSLDIGARQLLTKIPVSDPPAEDEIRNIRTEVKAQLSGLSSLPTNFDLHIMGGGAQALAGYAKALMGAPGDRIADKLYVETVDRLIKILSEGSLEERRSLPGSDPDRADIIIHGAIIISEIMQAVNAETAHVAAGGLVRGVFESEVRSIPLDPEQPVAEITSTDFRPINRNNRLGEVLFLLRHNDGSIWLQTKSHYPDGIYRIPGGGVEIGETPQEAVLREVAEETGIYEIRPIPLATMLYALPGDEPISFFTTIYLIDTGDKEPVCNDPTEAISGWIEAKPPELNNHAGKLQSLTGSREVWGKFRAAALRYVLHLNQRGSW